MRVKVFAALLLMGCLAVPSLAAMSFTNRLTSEPGLSPDLEEADAVTADKDILYSAAGAQIGLNLLGNDGRNHIHSTANDFNTVDFVAEVTVDYSTGGRMFMGLGGGEIGAYGTPDWDITDTVWLELGQYGLSNTFTYNVGDGGPNGPIGAGISVAGPEVRVQMSFDSATSTITFAIDDAYVGGPMTADFIVPAIDMSAFFTAGEDARVFIGGGSGVIVRDLAVAVVPEPASLALLGIGGLLVSRRRK